ncbi:MAG: 1-acyl-sn-glycerol-3-phosphate acyltransferase [Candidatus Rokuibacteriota bacterium]|nr:MAG: 1-acyl-sn-glycerol-3-phosphate acyltransferase [Candidatus Rokubacteria bacterium]
MLYAVLKFAALVAMRLLFRLRSHDRERVPPTGPVLLVANHSSLLDPPLVGGSAPRPVSFMAKAELFRIPLFGGLIWRLNARPVRRGGNDPSALRAALRVLERGGALLVFPEGTRGPEGELRQGKAGAGMLAVLSGASVVPVYINGSGRAWPRGQRLPRPSRVTVWFGEPISFAGQSGGSRKAAYEAASQHMMAAIGQLKERSKEVNGAGAGGAVLPPSKYIYGRSGQHGEA